MRKGLLKIVALAGGGLALGAGALYLLSSSDTDVETGKWYRLTIATPAPDDKAGTTSLLCAAALGFSAKTAMTTPHPLTYTVVAQWLGPKKNLGTLSRAQTGAKVLKIEKVDTPPVEVTGKPLALDRKLDLPSKKAVEYAIKNETSVSNLFDFADSLRPDFPIAAGLLTDRGVVLRRVVRPVLAARALAGVDVYGDSGKRIADSSQSKGSRLGPGGRLYPGDFIRADNGKTIVVFQSDGNLVLYNQLGKKEAFWSSQTAGLGGAFAELSNDGDLRIFDGAGNYVWGTGTSGHPLAYAWLNDDGDFAIQTRTSDHANIWTSDTEGFVPSRREHPPWGITSPGSFIQNMTSGPSKLPDGVAQKLAEVTDQRFIQAVADVVDSPIFGTLLSAALSFMLPGLGSAIAGFVQGLASSLSVAAGLAVTASAQALSELGTGALGSFVSSRLAGLGLGAAVDKVLYSLVGDLEDAIQKQIGDAIGNKVKDVTSWVQQNLNLGSLGLSGKNYSFDKDAAKVAQKLGIDTTKFDPSQLATKLDDDVRDKLRSQLDPAKLARELGIREDVAAITLDMVLRTARYVPWIYDPATGQKLTGQALKDANVKNLDAFAALTPEQLASTKDTVKVSLKAARVLPRKVKLIALTRPAAALSPTAFSDAYYAAQIARHPGQKKALLRGRWLSHYWGLSQKDPSTYLSPSAIKALS